MTTNVRLYPAHLRDQFAHVATDGYTVIGYQLRNLRKVYRAMRRSTGSATMARVAVLGVMGAGRNCPLDKSGTERWLDARIAEQLDIVRAVAA